MSTPAHRFHGAAPGPDVLGELLHSLSQPLTTLRCSLELEAVAAGCPTGIAAALQQTEHVIELIQLLREYLDAQTSRRHNGSSPLAPTVRSVVAEFASIAEVRGVPLRVEGSSSAALPLPEPRLRLVMQYLVSGLIEAQPAGGGVVRLVLGEGSGGVVLRADTKHCLRRGSAVAAPIVLGNRLEDRLENDPASGHPPVPAAATLREVRLAIATRILEAAGATLVVTRSFGRGPSGFALHISPTAPPASPTS
jgi:hypothetical protein